MRSRVTRRVGWQGWAGAGVRGMNEIFVKTASSEAGGRPSAMQLSSLSRICDANRVISAAECNNAAETFNALCGTVPGYTGNGVKQTTFRKATSPCPTQERSLQLALRLNQGGLRSLEGLAPGIVSIAKRGSRK